MGFKCRLDKLREMIRLFNDEYSFFMSFKLDDYARRLECTINRKYSSDNKEMKNEAVRIKRAFRRLWEME